MDIIFVDDNHYKIGNSDYGFYACDIHFDEEFIKRMNLSEDDKIDFMQALLDSMNNAIRDKE